MAFSAQRPGGPRPSKYLQHSEKYFAGYRVQLDAYLRRNENAEELLDGLLFNPLLRLVQAVSPDSAVDRTTRATARVIVSNLETLYSNANVGSPIGSLPTPQECEDDPASTIVDLMVATHKGALTSSNTKTVQ